MSRYDELNDRISARFVPDEPLRPNFDPIPISTKYYDVRGQTTQPRDLANYNDDPAFFPTNARGPITRFVKAIQLDTELRGQDRNTYRKFIPAMYTGYADANIPNLANYQTQIPPTVASAVEFNISTSRKAGVQGQPTVSPCLDAKRPYAPKAQDPLPLPGTYGAGGLQGGRPSPCST